MPHPAHTAYAGRFRAPEERLSPVERTLSGAAASNRGGMLRRVGQGGMLMENQTRRTRKTEQSDRPVEPLPGPASDSPSTVLALIERVVLDPRADAEKLDRMMAMYERLKAKEAELAFNGAKGRILKKLAGIKIVKNRPVLPESNNGKQRGTVEAAITKIRLCRRRRTPPVASQTCRPSGAPTPSCAAMSPATSSTSWLSAMMTTEMEERSMRPRPRPLSS